ncbi:MAG: diguanylate cyclase [Chloroflexi bacterium]|nr:diguanylate cyclase [Chloroflexota bacterium]
MSGRESANPSFAYPSDIQQIQGIQDGLSKCLGIALVITDTAARFITRPSGHAPLCLIEQRQAQFCPAVKVAADTGLFEQSEKALYVSYAGIGHVLVPIRVENALLGVMVAAQAQFGSSVETPSSDTVPRLVSPEEVSLGPLSGEQVEAVGVLLGSIAHHLVKLNAKDQLIDRHLRDLSAINEAGAAMTSTLDLHALSDIVLEKAASLVNAELAFLALPDAARGDLKPFAFFGLPSDAIRRMRFRLGEEVIGKAAQSKQPLLLNDMPLHTSIGEPRRSQLPQRASLITLPLLAKDELVGVLVVSSYAHRFEPRDLQILQSLANHATFAILNARLYDQAQQAIKRLNRLFELGADINGLRSLDEVLRHINRHALEATQGTACNINLIDDDGLVKTRAAVGFSPQINKRIVVRPNGLSAQVRQSGQPIIIPDTLAAADRVNPVMLQAGVRASICLPLRNEDRVIGVMWVHYAQPRSFPQSDLDLLLAFANQAATAIENAQLREELIGQAARDGKTRLFNHDFFFARLRIELDQARRADAPLSLIMLDIDHFKEYNDTLGHLAGDEALRVVASSIVAKTRKSDVVARYGGEEFAVLLPRTDAEHALLIAERIRTSIEASSRKLGPSVGPLLTVSLGVASFPKDAGTENELIDRADKALYKAKALGKNKATVFSP